MNINTSEVKLARFHVLHLIVGAAIAALFLAIPKDLDVLAFVLLASILAPAAILPEFVTSKWFDRIAVLVGATLVAVLFHYLGKL